MGGLDQSSEFKKRTRGHTFPPLHSHVLSLGPLFHKPSRSRITASAQLPRPRRHHGIEGTDEMLVGRVGEIKDRSTYLLFPLRTAATDDVLAQYSTLWLHSASPSPASLQRNKRTNNVRFGFAKHKIATPTLTSLLPSDPHLC